MTKTSPSEPHTGLQGEGGVGRDQGREDAGRIGAAIRCPSEPDHAMEGSSCSKGRPASSARDKGEATAPAVDLKALHAKIGELALENDFLSGALGKAGMLSAKR